MRRVDGRILRAAGWDHQVHTAFQQRRGNHEYDEQHKSEIEQRRDIDLAQCGEILALRVASHRNLSFRTKSRNPEAIPTLVSRDVSSALDMTIICGTPLRAHCDRRICAQTPMRARRRSCPSLRSSHECW